MPKIDNLEYLEFSNAKSSIKISLQGAHIFDFCVKGKKPLLFLSKTAKFKEGLPIRGGIPICWPWFGKHPTNSSLPNHGFARVSLWKHLLTQELSKDKTKIIMSLQSSPQSLAIWPYAFELILEIIISDILELSLITKNTGTKSFSLSQALHTYLLIEDIKQASIEGLDTKPYYNKLNDTYKNIQKGKLLFTEEVDRVYEECTQTLRLKDKNQDIFIQTQGSKAVVVWSPGEHFADYFSDLSGYKTMLCIESANTLESEITLEPSQSHTLKSILSQKEV